MSEIELLSGSIAIVRNLNSLALILPSGPI